MKHSALLRLLPVTVVLLGLPGLTHAAEPLSRAQFVDTLVHQVYPQDLHRNCVQDLNAHPYDRLFADVPLTHPMAQTICLGINYGLLGGDADARFQPDAPITLAEASKILAISHGVALPDSPVIRHLGWHWRFTEALKRRRVLDWRIHNYAQTVTADELQRMLTALQTARPAVQSTDQAATGSTRETAMPPMDRTQVLHRTRRSTTEADTAGRARPHRGSAPLPLASSGTHRLAR